MADLVSLIKKAAMDAVEASKPSQIVYGLILSVNPITIRISDRLSLTEPVVMIPERFTDHKVKIEQNGIVTEYMVKSSLEVGDKVYLLRNQGGQKFLLIDKVVST